MGECEPYIREVQIYQRKRRCGKNFNLTAVERYLKTQLTPECQDVPSANKVPCAGELQNWNRHAMAASSRCLAAKRQKLRLLPSLQGLIFYPLIQKPLTTCPHSSHIYMRMLTDKFQNYVKGELPTISFRDVCKSLCAHMQAEQLAKLPDS